VEVGDLSSREIEAGRAVADLFSHRGGRYKAGKAALNQLLAKLNA